MTAHQDRGSSPGRLVLGVDGGGSKTIARLMSVGSSGALCVVGEGIARGSNPLSVGSAASREAIRAAVGAAYDAIEDTPLADSAVLAIAGCGAPAVASEIEAWASDADLARRVWVVDDTRPLFATVDRANAAIGLIAGTGASAIARPAASKPIVVGGWGYLIDDAGSGFDMGQRGLRHAVRRLDAGGGQQDLLTGEAMSYTDAKSASDFKQRVYGNEDPRRFIAGFAAGVLGIASRGDATAEAIADDCAAALADLARTAWQRIGAPTNPLPAILLSGGLLERSWLYRRRVTRRLYEMGWSREAIRLAPDPATGCGLLALSRSEGHE